jgi:hypothetical protein
MKYLEFQQQFDKLQSTGKLFRSKLTGQQVWDIYLAGFTPDPVFRDPNSSIHNCNLCKNFIRRYGNIVAIDANFGIISMWDNITNAEYAHSAQQVAKALRQAEIGDVFFETFTELNNLPYECCLKTNTKFQLGVAKNVKRYTKEEAEKYGVVKPNEIREFHHLHLFLNKEFVDMSGKSIESIMAEYRDAKNVFQRGLQEISIDTLKLVKDLIIQGSLLDGQAHLFKIDAIIPKKLIFDQLSAKERDNWLWENSYRFQFAKFKNELIGVLCSELSEGEELNKACQSWNKRVDPVNYMKAVAPITKKQIEDARKFVEENGYEESFNRRFATIDDIKASEILHVNVGQGTIPSVSIFDNVKSTSTRHKRNEFDGVEEVSIEKFMADILPGCTSVEAFLTAKHEMNLVSLTTANVKESKPIFKWTNNYSWTFNGNLAGKSQIKEVVKEKGGNVEGVLRFSLIWNESGSDNSDLDAWCREASGYKIGYSTGYRKDRGDQFSPCMGQLDLDNTDPNFKLAVENIYFKDIAKLKNGDYCFWVNQYFNRGSKGFKAEIECNGEIYSYEYNKPVHEDVQIATVTYNAMTKTFNIIHQLPTTIISKDLYSLPTEQFHKVNLVCLSPNHWDENNVGNKHYFFMLEGCKSPISIRSFHAENLIPELAAHRKVLEVLGNTTMVEPTDKQLSGLGFNATVKDELIVKLQGSFKRMLKIKF